MKKCKSLLSVFMALAFAVMCIGINASFTVSADPTLEITVTNNDPNDTAEHTYQAYKIFDGKLTTNDDGDYVLSDIKWGSGVNTTDLIADLTGGSTTDADLKTAFNGCSYAYQIAEKLTDALAVKFAQFMVGHLSETYYQNSSYTPPSGGNGGKAVIDVTAGGVGYYLIKDNTIATGNPSTDTHGAYTAYILRVVGETAITSKSEVPTLTKKIDAGSSTYVDENSASIGDTITYHLESVIPNSIKTRGYTTYAFTITDNLSKGLTYTDNSCTVKVKVGSTETNITAAYTNDSTNGFKITPTTTAVAGETGAFTTKLEIKVGGLINFINALGDSSDDITVIAEYKATLNQFAVAGSSGNENKAYLEYSNDPNDTNAAGKTPESIVKTYTADIEIDKVKSDNSALAGAYFKITGDTSGADTNKLNGLVVNGTAYDSTAIGTVYSGTEGGFAVDSDGKLTIKGLNAGTYYIEETKEPDGYNKLNYKIKIVVAPKLVSGNWTGDFTVTATKSKIDGIDSDITEGEEFTGISGGVLTIVNNTGIVLPATGGIGTTIFYIAGGSIMILAGILFVTKKIVDSKEKKNR